MAQDTSGQSADGDTIVLEEILVTSQRRAESLQDVPLAVTALDAGALDKYQIESASDLQFQTPNVTFSKTNFTSTNFQIRGVGNTLVAASADAGVGIHINDMPVNAPRLFETEYFDIERIEILRGPQGTLFGRNSTGGTVNMITKKPTDEFEASGEFEYGNYNSVKAKGMFNVPIGDMAGLRMAGVYVNRDGYTQNLAADSSNGLSDRIDGRDLYSVRGSLQLRPGDNTTIDMMVSYFKEDDNRTRSQKQMCHRDPTGVLGCLPDSLEYEVPNANSTLVGVLTSREFLNAIGFGVPVAPGVTLGDLLAAGSVAGVDANHDNINPANVRQIYTDFEPVYQTDETLATLQLQQSFDSGTLTVSGGYQKTHLLSQQDYNMNASSATAVPIGLAYVNPTAYATYYATGSWPISAVTADSNTGLIGGNSLGNFASHAYTYDQSSTAAEQWYGEVRYNSEYDGPFNFLVGGTLLDYKSDFDYYVVAAGLDYVSYILPATDGVAMATPYYNSETDFYGLNSWAIFGELYYDISDTVKLTGGLRYTSDEKTLRDRQPLYKAPVAIGTTDASAALPPFRDDTTTFKEVTGRAVLEWTPSADHMVYASFSRGYKGGGFNPPSFTGAFAATFDPEFINAFEIGSKNSFMDGRITANLTGFYYDYTGLQVSKIVDRTSVNENIDAKIWGLEGEFVAAVTSNFLANLNVSYLNTEIGDSMSADPRDPSGGVGDAIIVKDLSNSSNCTILLNGAPAPVSTIDIPGMSADGAFSFCSALAAALPAPYEVLPGGVEVSLKGNELQQSPNWQVSLGGQYTHNFENGMSLVARADYYWQSSMWGRIYNAEVDKIASFDQLNIQATLYGEDDRWHVRAFVQNVLNDDSVVGMYITDPSSGLFTNLFTLEPRRIGVAVGFNF